MLDKKYNCAVTAVNKKSRINMATKQPLRRLLTNAQYKFICRSYAAAYKTFESETGVGSTLEQFFSETEFLNPFFS